MSAIITLNGGAKLPAYLQNRKALAVINDEVATGTSFPTLSIKGKVFTLVKGNEKKVLTKPDEDGEIVPVSSLVLNVVRANTKARVFYLKQYNDGDEGAAARPDCYSYDGVEPGHDAVTPQAKKCAACAHAVWGSKVSRDGQESKGTACTVNTRAAVIDPANLNPEGELEPFLLRVPAGSRSNFADIVKTAQQRGIPYNALALRVAFDMAAPSPKLTFKIVGLVNDETYDRVNKAYEGDHVKEMVGLMAPREALPAPEPEPAGDNPEADLDAVLAAQTAKPPTRTAAAKETTAAVIERVSRAPAPAPAPAQEEDALAGLDGLGDDQPDAAPPAPAPAPAPATRKPRAPKPEAAAPAPVAAAPVHAPAAPAADTGMDSLLGDLDDLLGQPDD
jgi:hypothetical protein